MFFMVIKTIARLWKQATRHDFRQELIDVSYMQRDFQNDCIDVTYYRRDYDNNIYLFCWSPFPVYSSQRFTFNIHFKDQPAINLTLPLNNKCSFKCWYYQKGSSSLYVSHICVARVYILLQVTHLPLVRERLLSLAEKPDRRDHRLSVSLPKDTDNVR